MAQSPAFKVYDSRGQYQAATKDAEAAAAMLAFYGEGATIRYGHKFVVWREGAESFRGCDSFDGAAEIIWQRVDAALLKLEAKFANMRESV